jgi:phospholipase C
MKRFLPLALAALAACSGGGSGGGSGPPPTAQPTGRQHGPLPPIQHVVVIVQENRSFDNLFNGFPGANTQSYGMNSSGQQVPLQPVSLTAPYDLSHIHEGFKREYAGGALNGFNLVGVTCKRSSCPPPGTAAYAYVPRSEIQPYWDLASQYVLADEMFQSNEGPSFPAHQYLVSGTSTIADGSNLRADDNAADPHGTAGQGGCDSMPGTTTKVIDEAGQQKDGPFPCYNRLSIFDLLDNAGVSWKYYEWRVGPGSWNGADAIKQIWQKPEYHQNVVQPPSQVLTDIANGTLPAVSFVTPTALASDHAIHTDGSGPAWVASVVNAIGASKYWQNTAVIFTEDDWGGWYDNVPPRQLNSYELGFRVPLIVISPYAKTGFVSHTQYEFGSILKFIEEEFNLPSMNTTDARSADLSDCFNPSQKLRHFRHIKSKLGPAYFLRQRNEGSPDDD